jgi:hypothetical protein
MPSSKGEGNGNYKIERLEDTFNYFIKKLKKNLGVDYNFEQGGRIH